jgi:MFS family permease
MPAEHRGAISGIATTTKGWGLLIGPLVAGVLIDVLSPYLQATNGYQVLWVVCAVPVLAVIPIVASLLRAEEPRGKAEPQLG